MGPPAQTSSKRRSQDTVRPETHTLASQCQKLHAQSRSARRENNDDAWRQEPHFLSMHCGDVMSGDATERWCLCRRLVAWPTRAMRRRRRTHFSHNAFSRSGVPGPMWYSRAYFLKHVFADSSHLHSSAGDFTPIMTRLPIPTQGTSWQEPPLATRVEHYGPNALT